MKAIVSKKLKWKNKENKRENIEVSTESFFKSKKRRKNTFTEITREAKLDVPEE